MKKPRLICASSWASSLKNRKGAVMPLLAISIFVLVAILAFAIDIGFVAATNNELQNVADSAALAGAGELGCQYSAGCRGGSSSPDIDAIRTIAKDVASKNKAANKPIDLNDADIELGRWANNAFSPTYSGKPNAVRVTARRDSSANGPFGGFFASLLGVNQFSRSKDAVAALTGASEVDDGELEPPVGISKSWFELNENYPNFCDQSIQFYPTSGTSGCAGWNTYDQWPANANRLREILDGLKEGTVTAPHAKIGDEFVFTGGNVSSATDSMYELWDSKRTQDGDGNDGVWTTKVVVYDEPCGSNPSGYIKLAGFATVRISGVEGPPPVLKASVICEETTQARGGGGDYGTWGSIPNLVE